MAGHKTRRIVKELADIKSDTTSHITAEPINENLTNLKGTFNGPEGTPYEGGIYEVSITIPNEYPFTPPVMKFITRIWHPNISSQTGAICLDTLKAGWSPVLTIKSAMISLQSLLSTPEPKDPQDAMVARELIKNPKQFERNAREWAVKYAGAPKTKIAGGSGGSTAQLLEAAEQDQKEREGAANLAVYDGYNKDMVDRFSSMGFDVPMLVDAFNYVGVDRNDGTDYELDQDLIEDIMARILHED